MPCEVHTLTDFQWHCYNLIRENDLLRASALRKVTTESAAGSTTTQRVQTVLTIRVTKLDFDSYASQLHVSGRVAEENKHVKLGSYHTLDLELQRNFTLEKADGWDSVAIDTLKEAINQDAKAQLWAVVLQEGLANICLVTDHQTILRQQIEVNMPKKRAGSSDHDKALQRFFQTTFDTVLRQIDLTDPKPLLLASPGFTASSLQQFIKTKASESSDKDLKQLIPKITVAHSASGHLHSLAEVLSSPAVTSKLSDTKFARETQLMDRFFELLRKDDARAWYGPKEVEAAVERGAVGKGGGSLLISNSLFRAQDVKTRQRWVKLVDEVKEGGGEVRVLSSMHESGRRLEDLTGIAAILTYPIEGLDDEVGGEEDKVVDDDDDFVPNGRNHVPDEDIDF
jgi:protein pelota